MLINIFERLEFGDEKNLLIQGIPSTLEKFFTKYLFDNILEKGKLFSKFANGELKVELNTSSRLYT